MKKFKRPYIIEQDLIVFRAETSAKELAEDSIYNFMEDDGLKVELAARPRFRFCDSIHGEYIYLRLILRAVGRYF